MSIFLDAFKGKATRVPIWFMRQAGRYLPQYQAIKKQYALRDMFRNPDVATEITLQPIRLLNFDAAILFADILTLPSNMGFDIDFIDGKGPVVANPIKTADDIHRMSDFKDLDYVSQTVRNVKVQLPKDIPLIGFAGSPFTVLSYLMDGASSNGLNKALRFAYQDSGAYHKAMSQLTRNTIRYIQLQHKAGIDAFQLFDTWGGVLRAVDYQTLLLPYVKAIFKAINLPSIYYLKNCAHLLPLMEKTGSDFLSVCETVEIGHHPILNKTKKGVQGNLYNGLLYAEDAVLKAEVRKILNAARRHHKKYIFNLSHGIFPDVPVEKVKLVIKEVQGFKW